MGGEGLQKREEKNGGTRRTSLNFVLALLFGLQEVDVIHDFLDSVKLCLHPHGGELVVGGDVDGIGAQVMQNGTKVFW